MRRERAAGARAHGGGDIVQVVPLRPVACHVVVRVLPLAHPAVGEPAVVLVGDRRRRQHAGRRARRARERARPRRRRRPGRCGGVRSAARRGGRRPPRPAHACRAGRRRRRRRGAARAARRGGQPPPGGGGACGRRRAQPQSGLAWGAPRQAQAPAIPRPRRCSRGDLPRRRLPRSLWLLRVAGRAALQTARHDARHAAVAAAQLDRLTAYRPP